MSIQDAILFRADGRATPLFLAQWRSKTPLAPLQAGSALVDENGISTPYFRSLWRAAFPTRLALPMDRLADADGTGTLSFWDVFR